MPWDKAPVNLSFLLDPPAGKHGFLGVKGNRFVFEDGVEIRFWGTSMIGSACFPPQNLAPDIAERLSRFGINLVRFQHLDAAWAEPNLFMWDENQGVLFNPETLDRLDYFLYQLENRGIYAFMDGLDSRVIRAEDHILEWQGVPPGFGGLIHFSPAIQSLYRDFLLSFWSRRNRYTHLEYRDSPMIVMAQLFYDNNIKPYPPMKLPYTIELHDRWRQWQQHKAQPFEPQERNRILEQPTFEPPPDLDLKKTTRDMQNFLVELVGETNVLFHDFLRGVSVKCPITGTGLFENPTDLLPQRLHDFIAASGIWNQPLHQFRYYPNRNMIEVDLEQESDLFSELAFARLKNKPFVVSEWGNPWPNEWRAELPLWMAAMACLQDWQGCISSGYRTIYDPQISHMFAPYELFNDPCVIGLFPAAALLFHQNEIQSARRTARIRFDENYQSEEEPLTPLNTRATRLASSMKIEIDLDNKSSAPFVFSTTTPENLNEKRLRADKNQNLRRDPERGLILIDTPRAQAAIGQLKNVLPDDLSQIKLDSEEEFGVVCVSSMNKNSISRSNDLLVSIVSQARNSDFSARQEGGGSMIENAGRAPILIKDTPVRLFIRTVRKDWTIQLVQPDGGTNENLPYQIEKDALSFRVGVHGTLFYRLRCNG
jgi:hypothetical protein